MPDVDGTGPQSRQEAMDMITRAPDVPALREQPPSTPNMSGAGRWQPGSEAPPGLGVPTALIVHDTFCPEGGECRSRELHATFSGWVPATQAATAARSKGAADERARILARIAEDAAVDAVAEAISNALAERENPTAPVLAVVRALIEADQ